MILIQVKDILSLFRIDSGAFWGEAVYWRGMGSWELRVRSYEIKRFELNLNPEYVKGIQELPSTRLCSIESLFAKGAVNRNYLR